MVRGLCVTVLLAACGGGEAPSEPATSGTGGASSSGSSTAGAGAGNGFVPRMFHLSVLAETEPGRAPALLRLDNATPEDRLAITLPDGEAFAFYDIPWQTTTDYVPAALSDPVAEVILSLCTIDACIRINFDEIGGEQALAPLGAYSLVVTKPGDFAAEIVGEPDPEPFVGVRPHVIDGSAGIAVGTHLDLVLS